MHLKFPIKEKVGKGPVTRILGYIKQFRIFFGGGGGMVKFHCPVGMPTVLWRSQSMSKRKIQKQRIERLEYFI